MIYQFCAFLSACISSHSIIFFEVQENVYLVTYLYLAAGIFRPDALHGRERRLDGFFIYIN